MNRFFQRFCYIFVANTTLLMTTAAYAETEAVDFRVDRSDASLQLLEQIFGLVDGVLYGSGTQVVGKMFGVFNASVLALGGIFLTYTMLVSTINTAQDGEVMGKQWSSVWVPMRVTCGVGLLVPKASGYCMMQVFVMWIVVQGVGAANQVWGAALDYLEEGGVLYSKPAAGVGDDSGADLKIEKDKQLTKAADILEALVCMKSVEVSLNKWRREVNKNGVSVESIPDFFGTLVLDKDHKSVSIPNFPLNSEYENFKSLHGICGSIKFTDFDAGGAAAVELKAGTEVTTRGWGWKKETHTVKAKADQDSFGDSIAKANEQALVSSVQLLEELNRTASVIVERNNEQVTNYKEAISKSDEDLSDLYPNEEVEDPKEDYENVPQLGSCVEDNDGNACGDWGTTNGTTPLLSGYELQTAVLSYYALIMPYLNNLNRDKKKVEFVPRAKKQGWITAGSYFYDMARLNTDLSKINADSFFLIQVDTSPSIVRAFDDKSDRSDSVNGKFDTLEKKLLNNQTTSVNLFDDYIRLQVPDKLDQTKVTGGVPALWRAGKFPSDGDERFDTDDTKSVSLKKSLLDRKSPEGFFKEANYKSYFKLRGLVRTPNIGGMRTGGCSFWKMHKCVFNGFVGIFLGIMYMIIDFFMSIVTNILISVELLLNQIMGNLFDNLITGMFKQATNPSGHPIINMASAGENMMEGTWDAFLTLVLLLIPFAIWSPSFALVLWTVVFKKIIAVLMIFLIVFGYSFAFYAPMLPWMIFLFAALGWMLAVIEAMVAAPIVALGLTHPEGQNQVFGKAEQAIMIIINVFLRPSLMVIGFIIGIVLSYAFIQFAAITFAKVNSALMGSASNNVEAMTSGTWNDSSLGAQNQSLNTENGKIGVTGMLGPIFTLFIFMFVYTEIVKKCFSLTYLLPDQILRWLSGGVAEQFGSQTAGQMEQAVGQQAQKAEQSGLPTPKALDGADKVAKIIGKNDDDEE